MVNVIGAMSNNADPHLWERQVSQMKGVLITLRMLRALPLDAKAVVERDSAKNS